MNTALLILSFLLFAFTTNASEPVLDSIGEPLVPGGQYYVLPYYYGRIGGGLLLKKTGNQTCPVSAVSSSRPSRGKPVVFSPVLNLGAVFTHSPLEISFAEAPDCTESGKWLVTYDQNEKYWSVGIGGANDHQENQTLTGHFRIHKYDRYVSILSFNPVENAPTSGYIELAGDEDGNGRLVVKDEEETSYKVIFLKGTSQVSEI